MPTLYGIPNCDTMKKARAWLDQHGVEYRFHDYRKQGLDEDLLRSWVDELGWETLINRRGMMWRKLDQASRDQMDEQAAIQVMLATPSIIKRPVLDTGDRRVVGFAATEYEALFA